MNCDTQQPEINCAAVPVELIRYGGTFPKFFMAMMRKTRVVRIRAPVLVTASRL